jgi:hypothetical protein
MTILTQNTENENNSSRQIINATPKVSITPEISLVK